MLENDRLSGGLEEIDLEFVEREATPQLLMKLSIQLHLAGLSLSNTVSFLEIFGVERDAPPSITGFTRPIYSPRLDGVRITSRLTKP
jgi:hypothetical protein